MFKNILNDIKEGYTCEYTTRELIVEYRQFMLRMSEAKNLDEIYVYHKLIEENKQQRLILDMKMARKSLMLRLGRNMGLISFYLKHGYV